jgi:phenylalanyl-tRNA synthetase beta chain
LGIDVPAERVRSILATLGNQLTQAKADRVEVIPPSWRRDLTREIDLVEEIGRINGYDKVPEDVGVPMVRSTRTVADRVVAKVRDVLTAAAFDEAVTISVVDPQTARTIDPWTDAEPLRSLTPVLRGADRLRTSLVPSLLAARRANEALGNAEIELFEIAKIYLSRGQELPDEEPMVGLASGRDWLVVKGVVEAIVAALNPAAALGADDAVIDLLDPAAACRLSFDGRMLCYVGQLTEEGLKRFELRRPATVAEIKLSLLVRMAELVPRHLPSPPYPAVARDLNLVVDESVRWADLSATVRENCGEYLEDLEYQDTYRDAKRLGAGKKSLLMTIALRSKERTLTNQEADEIRERIVVACGQEHGAQLRT